MDCTNKQGCSEHTAYKEIENIERMLRATHAYRPLVYVCSPFGGQEHNLDKARKYCRFVVECGSIPIAPHLLFPQFLNDADELERELGMHFCHVLLSKCSAIWVFGDEITQGMKSEIEHSKEIKKLYFDSNLEERIR